VVGLIEQAIAEGATLLAGGPECPEELKPGLFVRPTVLGDVTPAMTVAREESVRPGPVDHRLRHGGAGGADRQ
jgi:aldehyde dehydrogenase (NAD+)